MPNVVKDTMIKTPKPRRTVNQGTARNRTSRPAQPVRSDVQYLAAAKTTIEAATLLDHTGIVASQGPWYSQAIFGRDSASAGLLLLGKDQRLVHDIIFELARLQGQKTDRRSGEEPGRIHHEYRDLTKWHPGRKGRHLATLYSLLWGGSLEEMHTFFSSDSTPLFILLVSSYCHRYGFAILDRVVHGDATLADCVVSAAEWLQSCDHDGLVAHKRMGLFCPSHQSWKDSPTAYLHTNGGLPASHRPMSYIIIQALAADALMAASNLGDHLPGNRSDMWRHDAKRWRATLIERFWMPEQRYFASLLDQDRHGNWRQLETLCSDPGWLLDTGVFDDLSEKERLFYVQAITRRLFSDDFLTTVGIRSRALRHYTLVKLADYHGSQSSWPLDTQRFVSGLRKQGYPRLAKELTLRLEDGLAKSGHPYEYWVVTPNGTVQYRPEAASKRHLATRQSAVPVQIIPEPGFSWTAAVAINLSENIPGISSIDSRFESGILYKLTYRYSRGQKPAVQRNLTPLRLSLRGGILRLGWYIATKVAASRF